MRIPAALLLLSSLAVPAEALQFTPNGPSRAASYPAVSLVLLSPSAPQVVYAVSGISLLRSDDAGVSWVTRPRPDAVSPVRRLVIDPTNADILYALAGSALYRTEDGGANWTPLPLDAEVALAASGLLIDPVSPSKLYLFSDCSASASAGGVRRSTNGGLTWVRIADPPGSDGCTSSLALDPAAPTHLYRDERAVRQCESRTAGDVWSCSDGPLPVRRVVADPTNLAYRYGTTMPPPTGASWDGTLLTSVDGGDHWALSTPPGLDVTPDDLAVEPVHGTLLAASSTLGLLRSDDHGGHWSRVSSVPASTTSLAIGGAYAFAATTHGLYRAPLASLDFWTPLPTGDFAPRPLNANAMALDPNVAATLYLSASENVGPNLSGSLWRSRDSGRVWVRISPDEGIPASFIAVDGASDLYASDGTTIWRFTRVSETWASWSSPVPLTGLMANPRFGGWLYSGRYLSMDGGHTWQVMDGLDPLVQVTVATNGFDVYASTTLGFSVSHDAGLTWRRLEGAPVAMGRIVVAPSQSATIYGTGLMTLFRSDDGGATWAALPFPFAGGDPLVVDPRDDRSVWLGLHHSMDGGQTWETEPSNLQFPPSDMAIDRDGRTLHVLMLSTHWSATLRGTHRRAVD